MKKLMLACCLFFIPVAAKAAADVSISPSDIRFSESELVAGDEVRIYGKIYNVGDEDVSGYVTFYQGATLIGNSLVISIPTNGNADEVYVDFVVPDGSFNILALIQGTDPADTNSTNDTALTETFIPFVDDDRDGVGNDADNCDVTANSDQQDTDGDGEGDACDVDDDNDGLSDEVEVELNSDPTNPDSDEDGVEDADDAYPDDAQRVSTQEDDEREVAEETEGPASTNEAFQKIVEEVAKTIKETTEIETPAPEQGEELPVNAEIQISPNAVFTYVQNDWNTFSFTVVDNLGDQAVYIWDFGDGVTSSKPAVQHVYGRAGSFQVTLTTTDENSTISTESTTIFVPFFHLKNRFVLVLVGLLIISLFAGMAAFVRLGRPRAQ